MAPDGDPRPSALTGAVLAGVGVFLSAISLDQFAALQPLRDFWFCLGLALLIAGIGALAYACYVWQDEDWGYPVTFGALAALIAIATWAAQSGSVALFAVSAGAIGGLAHEIAQSNGKIALPGKQKPAAAQPAPAAAPAPAPVAPAAPAAAPAPPPVAPAPAPADTEIYLGSLTGMFLGGVAGALILSSTQQAGLSLGLTAFMAGLALKGVSEAASTAATR